MLFNALSGALDDISGDLSGGDLLAAAQASPDLANYLITRGYLYNTEADEKERFESLYAGYLRFKREIRPLIFYLVLTYRCNLACDYCFQKSIKPLDGTITNERLAPIFDAICLIQRQFEATRTKPVVALFGGEPLMRRNLQIVTRIFELVASHGYVNGPIISNGVELDSFLPLFREFPPSGIQITIDGPREIHNRSRHFANCEGTFDRIVENVNRALEAGIKIGLRTNLDERNVGSLPALVSLAESQGWIANERVQLSLAPVHQRACGSWTDDPRRIAIFEQVLNAMREYPHLAHWTLDGWSATDHFARLLDGNRSFLPRFDHCEAAVGKSFHLDGYGYIYSCIEACGMPEYAAGRYQPRLEFTDLYERLRQRDVRQLPACERCAYALVCGGGCAFQTLLDHRPLNASTCGDTQAAIDSFIRYRFTK